MLHRDSVHYLRSIGLGLLTGSRTLAVLAALSSRLARKQPAGWRVPLRWLTNPGIARLLQFMAAAELIGDKLPNTPARTEPESLAGRTLSGALTGTLFSAAKGRSKLVGGLTGALSALGGAFLGYHTRRYTVEKSGLTDPVIALVEDAVVLGGARLLLHHINTSHRQLKP